MKHDNLNEFMHDGWSYSKNFGSVSEKQIENAVNKYFENNPDYSITPSQAVQIYNEVKQESEG